MTTMYNMNENMNSQVYKPSYLNYNNYNVIILLCVILLSYIIISKYMNTVMPHFRDNIALHLVVISIIVVIAKVNIQIGILLSILYVILMFKSYNTIIEENFSAIVSEENNKKKKM